MISNFSKLVDKSKLMFFNQIIDGGVSNDIHNVGIDIGYGSLKVMSKYGLHKIQSLVIPFVKPIQANTSLQNLYMNDDDILYIENSGTFDEKIWAVGQKSLDMLDSDENYIDIDEYYNKKWFLNKEFQILFNVGIFLSQLKSDFSLKEEVQKYNICIGLPVQWVKYHKELQEALSGKRNFKIMMKDKIVHDIEFNISIEDIVVIPQHEGTINSMLLDYEGNEVDKLDFANRNILLIDAGIRTVDAHLLLKNNKGKSKTWLDVAMLSVKNDVCNYISEETDSEREILEFQLDRYILGQTPCTIKCGKKIIDFTDILVKSVEEKIKILCKRIQMVYELDDIDCILIAGGTGLCYFDEFSKMFDVNEICLAQDLNGLVPFDATLSNVIGYYKLLIYFDRVEFEDSSVKKKMM